MFLETIQKLLRKAMIVGLAALSVHLHAEPAVTTTDLPLELRPGERFFRCDGRPTFVLGRNPVGTNPKEYASHFQHAAAAGERFVRIHFTFISPGEKPGEIDAGMLQKWDAILDAANSLKIHPVGGFGCNGWKALFDIGRTVAPSWDGKYSRNSIC